MSAGQLPTPTSIAAGVITFPDPTDESTRYLASAVHLDDRLADELVEETLAEPRRAIPPSPGLRNETVLREAVVARARRLVVDVAAILLTIPVLVLFFGPFLFWLAIGIVWRVATALVSAMDRRLPGGAMSRFSRSAVAAQPGQQAPERRWTRNALGGVIGVILLAVLAVVLLNMMRGARSLNGLFGQSSGYYGYPGSYPGYSSGYPGYESTSSSDTNTWVFVILALLILATFFIERFLTWRYVTTRFSYGGPTASANTSEFARRASRDYETRLRQIAEFDGQRGSDSVVVYRSYDPFVGSGELEQRWSIALELRPLNAKDAANGGVPSFRPRELQDFVAAEVLRLRQARTLTPGHRFTGLDMTHQIVVSADAMLHYRDAAPMVQQLVAGQNVTVPAPERDVLIDSSPEWMRYYRGYRVESWERQMVVSAFLRAGCEERVLYLEWNGFVLPPIAEAYRQVDREPGTALAVMRSLWRAFGALVVLPSTLPGRLTRLVRAGWNHLSPPPNRPPAPAKAAKVFGSAMSVRERAAGGDLRSYLHAVDAEQYLKIMERRVLDAIHRFLVAKGISTAEFDTHATQIINKWVIRDSQIIGANLGGTGNTASVGNVGEGNRTGGDR